MSDRSGKDRLDYVSVRSGSWRHHAKGIARTRREEGCGSAGYAVAWAREHAAADGGDPTRIAIFGQSAGACHVLTWLFDPVFKDTKPVYAVVLSSGTYRVAAETITPNASAYFGSDPSQYVARSPITHVHRSQIPFLLTVSEFDPPFLASPTFELGARLTNENGRAPQLLWLAGHNHVSSVLSIGTPDNEVANLMSGFLKRSLS
jgi:dipeptidyl aminopeptidase/acylaminoacyl peptidase